MMDIPPAEEDLPGAVVLDFDTGRYQLYQQAVLRLRPLPPRTYVLPRPANAAAAAAPTNSLGAEPAPGGLPAAALVLVRLLLANLAVVLDNLAETRTPGFEADDEEQKAWALEAKCTFEQLEQRWIEIGCMDQAHVRAARAEAARMCGGGPGWLICEEDGLVDETDYAHWRFEQGFEEVHLRCEQRCEQRLKEAQEEGKRCEQRLKEIKEEGKRCEQRLKEIKEDERSWGFEQQLEEIDEDERKLEQQLEEIAEDERKLEEDERTLEQRREEIQLRKEEARRNVVQAEAKHATAKRKRDKEDDTESGGA